MTFGKTPRQADLFRTTASFCEPRLRADSIYALLHREFFELFPDELFDARVRRHGHGAHEGRSDGCPAEMPEASGEPRPARRVRALLLE
jgi:hypothetical protein